MTTSTLDRLVARVDGDAALTFLHAVLSQDVAALPAGRAATACYLDANAHVLAEIRVLHLPDGSVMLEAEPAAAPAFETLTAIAGLSGCEITIEPWVLIPERGDASELAEDQIAVTDRGIEIGVAWGGPGVDLLQRGSAAEIDAGYESARIEAGRPRFGRDVTDDLYIFETPLLARAVSFTKGCYPGQESVARVVNLGAPKRKLARIAFEGEAPAVDTDLEGLGRVTSAAGRFAIALVKADVPDGATVAGGEVRALV